LVSLRAVYRPREERATGHPTGGLSPSRQAFRADRGPTACTSDTTALRRWRTARSAIGWGFPDPRSSN